MYLLLRFLLAIPLPVLVPTIHYVKIPWSVNTALFPEVVSNDVKVSS